MKYSFFLLLCLLYLINCQNFQKEKSPVKESKPNSGQSNAKTRDFDPGSEPKDSKPFVIPAPSKETNSLVKITKLSEYNRALEGFVNSSTFQVKVTSLKLNKEEAKEEAEEVAKKKAVKLLISEAIPYLSPEGKVEIKILVEEYGNLVAESDFLEEKFYFIFQVKRPALEIIIKEKLK